MDVTDISSHLDKLDGDVNKLEEVLKPILADLGEVASKLPLLDKAKLYVLATYAIENALFSALRLQGIDARQHPVFQELARVKQYFQKIKKLEEPPAERTQAVDTQAAIRFIKADLADNQDINTKLKEQLAKERAKAAIKASRAKGQKRPAEDQAIAESSKSAAESAAGGSDEEGQVHEPEKKRARKPKGDKTRGERMRPKRNSNKR